MSALRVRAVVLPDGEPREFFVADGRITFEPVADADSIVDGGWVLPGLADLHCHVGLGSDGAVPLDVAREQARTDRDAGALLLRDAGTPRTPYELDAEPDLPRIIHAGKHLARTKRYVRNYADEMEPLDLPAAAEAQARRGGGWVKIVGDWIDRSVGDMTPCWPADVLAEAVRRAHDAGARVAVHSFSEEAIPDLVAAGVDSIEHATGLAGEWVGEVAARGIAIVPTLVNIATFDDIADRATKYPVYAARMRRLRRSVDARVLAAYEAGVPVFVGTDAGGVLPHGLVVREMHALAAAGLPNEAVLAAGSWGAREYLGLPGLVEGAPADLVAYDADPRRDLAVLDHPRRIVVKGTVVR